MFHGFVLPRFQGSAEQTTVVPRQNNAFGTMEPLEPWNPVAGSLFGVQLSHGRSSSSNISITSSSVS